MRQKRGAKGQNLCAKPRKRPSKKEIARHIIAMKRRLIFHPFRQEIDEENENQEVVS